MEFLSSASLAGTPGQTNRHRFLSIPVPKNPVADSMVERARRAGLPVAPDDERTGGLERRSMIFSIEKRRFRGGNLHEMPSYYLRCRIGDMPVDKWESLGVTDIL
jgi:hypothetical protein